MDAKEFQELMRGILTDYGDRKEEGEGPDIEDTVPHSVMSFKEYGILNFDNGLVVKMDDGNIFTMTIKKYRY